MSGVVYPAELVGQGGTVISLVKVKDTNCSAFLRIPHNQDYTPPPRKYPHNPIKKLP